VTDVLGWAGSALLVFSLLQARVLRFRVLNLAASILLVVFNLALAVWPMVAVNAAIAVINVWHVGRLLRSAHDDRRYDVVAIGADEPYLGHLLQLHRRDIERFNPGALGEGEPAGVSSADDAAGIDLLAGAAVRPVGAADRPLPSVRGGGGDGDGDGRLAFLVLTGAETVGVVLAHRTAPGVAQVDLDYVLPRFRDFTPGEFVYRPDGAFARQGVRRIMAPRRMREADRYLRDVGFRPSGDDLVLDLT
jgi:hypothetical protein